MATISKLKQVLELIEAAGHGEEFLSAEHDEIYLLPPDVVDSESELGQKLDKLGAHYSASDGWYMFT